MIYLLEDPISLTQTQYAQACGLASSQRMEKVNRYRFEADRKQSLCAYLLLRYALREEYNIKDVPLLANTEGKPSLVGYENIHFNLSHCRCAVACIVSDRPVGVDVQDWERDHSRLAERVCSADEQAYIHGAQSPETAFAQIWTAKESYGKYMGQGILYDLPSVSFVKNGKLCAPDGLVLECVLRDDFALSYCGEQKEALRQVTLSELLQENSYND